MANAGKDTYHDYVWSDNFHVETDSRNDFTTLDVTEVVKTCANVPFCCKKKFISRLNYVHCCYITWHDHEILLHLSNDFGSTRMTDDRFILIVKLKVITSEYRTFQD